MFETNQQIGLITFGLGGHHEYPIDPVEYFGPNKSSKCISHGTSGYERPETFKPKIHHEGSIVLDQRSLFEEYPSLAFKSPMCSNEVQGISECPEPSPIFAAAVSDNQFGTLLAVHKAIKRPGEPGPLDTVNIAEFVKWWQQYDVKSGRVINGQIIWDKKPIERTTETQLTFC